MNSTLEVIFGLLGGLAVFIFGMNTMSDCLQKAAGEKMKRILALLTKNPILGVLAGALTTAVLQSSSATTVMVIGFVSAGLRCRRRDNFQPICCGSICPAGQNNSNFCRSAAICRVHSAE